MRTAVVAAAALLVLAGGVRTAALSDDRPRRPAALQPALPARPPQPSTVPPLRPDKRHVVEPEAYGAVGDGVADDSDALQAALDDARPGDAVVLAADRTYRHSRVLVVSRAGTRLQGPGALLASNEERSALVVRADDVVLDGLVLRLTGSRKRWTGLDQHRLVLGRQARTVVTGVRVEGSAGAGVYVEGARDFRLSDLRVFDTRADGIHITGGARHGLVERPVVSGSGDDGVAVVSYDADPDTTRDILVQSPTVLGTTGGRGISVVGGEDITYRDVLVERSSAAALYVASEGKPFYTRAPRRVRIEGVVVRGANHTKDIDHGAVLVYAAEGREVDDVRISQVRITGTRAGASRQVGVLGDEGSVRSVVLERFDVIGGGQPFESTAGDSAYRTTGWTVNGRPVNDRGSA